MLTNNELISQINLTCLKWKNGKTLLFGLLYLKGQEISVVIAVNSSDINGDSPIFHFFLSVVE